MAERVARVLPRDEEHERACGLAFSDDDLGLAVSRFHSSETV
jgi:hypothetical protein